MDGLISGQNHFNLMEKETCGPVDNTEKDGSLQLPLIVPEAWPSIPLLW
jgi:hypothetical protein